MFIPTIKGYPVVSIGWASPELRVWRCASPAVHLLDDNERIVSLLIQDIVLANEDDACCQLETFGAAALFELHHLGFVARLREHAPWRLYFGGSRQKHLLRPLVSAPPIAPMSLYWQALFAESMPTRFMAYYQVLEHMFAKNTKEKAALANVILNIISADDLRAFVEADRDMVKHYNSPNQGIVAQSIELWKRSVDPRPATALRLYEIRCRLVHAKQYAHTPVFLAFSPESADLRHDVLIIAELARRALERASIPLG